MGKENLSIAQANSRQVLQNRMTFQTWSHLEFASLYLNCLLELNHEEFYLIADFQLLGAK